jgi:hypothetical protein
MDATVLSNAFSDLYFASDTNYFSNSYSLSYLYAAAYTHADTHRGRDGDDGTFGSCHSWCCCTDANRDHCANPDIDCYIYPDVDGDGDPGVHSNADGHRDADRGIDADQCTYAHGDGHSYPYSDGNVDGNTDSDGFGYDCIDNRGDGDASARVADNGHHQLG